LWERPGPLSHGCRVQNIADTTWFASFAPLEKPAVYAVVVMIETDVNAGTGGSTCAPIAGNIYRGLGWTPESHAIRAGKSKLESSTCLTPFSLKAARD